MGIPNIDIGNNRVLEYSDILQFYDATYKPAEYYWQVGEIKQGSGWVLHLSAIRVQIPDLLHAIIPELIAQLVVFKIIRDYNISGTILDGGLGHTLLGKIVSIYPDDDQQSLRCARKLITLTKGFRGPGIPTAHHLGAIVNTQFETFPSYSMIGYSNTQALINRKQNTTWPFNEIVAPQLPKLDRLLNYSYYPVGILKPDAKGNVIKAIYFKKLLQIKYCLIKQGRSNMFADDQGRDIQDRLQWQYNLYRELAEEIPLPVIFDYFTHGKDKYLAMEFIKGISLTKWIFSLYQDRIWQDLPLQCKEQLLKTMIKIISIIERLHKKGYIHRDITPENFLIEKNGKLSMIDMELAWNSITCQPNPPFRLGSFGFMSFEQQQTLTPTQKEDIYGLGGLLLVFFTNLFPLKFDTNSVHRLEQQLFFFTAEKQIGKLISNCMHPDPVQRPELITIKKELESYSEKIRIHSLPVQPLDYKSMIFKDTIEATIQLGLNGLTLPILITPKNRWASKAQTQENSIGNEQLHMTVYHGWHTGMAGPLWLVAKAKNVGFSIDTCRTAYPRSWEYIKEHYFKNPDSMPKGLYAGGPGIALALMEGLKCGLLTWDTDTIHLFQQCFSQSLDRPDLSAGWAGEGIALLHCIPYLEDQYFQYLLHKRIELILKSQKTDGSWGVPTNTAGKKNIFTGLDKGIAGIVWFLLTYLQRYPDNSVKKAVYKGLDWLIQKSSRKNSVHSWTVSTTRRITDPWSSAYGVPGILLAFIKAYEVLKESLYQKIAEKSLEKMISRPAFMDFTLETGLAGIGELYLEAFRVFDNSEWGKRASWIAGSLMHCFQLVDEDTGFWIAQPSTIATADLFTGNSGLLHFLIRSSEPLKIKHPLDPNH